MTPFEISQYTVHKVVKWWVTVVIFLHFATGTPLSAQLIPDLPIVRDIDGDGHSDIWQTYHGVGSLDSDGDMDHDGITNGIEAFTRTDPADPYSRYELKNQYITSYQFDGTAEGPAIKLSFQAIAGVRYQLRMSPNLEPGSWIDEGLPFEMQVNGEVEHIIPAGGDRIFKFSENNSPTTGTLPQNRVFFNYHHFHKDEDQDGISAADEFIIGTSDENPNTFGNPEGNDVDVAVAWLENNQLGIEDPKVPQSNLQEVDVAWVRQPNNAEDLPALLVTATGTGAWHRLTSWKVGSDGIPMEVASPSPIEGRHPKIVNLYPDVDLIDPVKNFVTGRIRDNGDFWLSSRALFEEGKFIFYQSKGFGSNANRNVIDYAIAQQAMVPVSFITHYHVVTALIVAPEGSNAANDHKLRVLIWQVDADTGALTALGDSGDLSTTFFPSTALDAGLKIDHLGGFNYMITYTGITGTLVHQNIWVENDGTFHYGGGGSSGQNIRGDGSLAILQKANALTGISSNGYVTANRNNGGELEMITWERRPHTDKPLEFEAYKIASNELDLGPQKGVALDGLELSDSWRDLCAPGERIGTAFATGDFNGDGLDDLAIGASERTTSGVENAGGVYIIHGSSDGITDRGYDQLWTQDSEGILAEAEKVDAFGGALVSGDFNNDGNDDLAISAWSESIAGVQGAGMVHVLYGTPFGLSADESLSFSQSSIGGTNGDNEYFGWALAAGDFNGDDHDDLAIGTPNDQIDDHIGAGGVNVLFGGADGISLEGSDILHQDLEDLWDTAEDGDSFGWSLAAGNFNGDAFDDLAVGVTREDIGEISTAGAVQVILGGQSEWGFDVFISQDGFAGGGDIQNVPENSDQFGRALVAGDFNNDGVDDLAIGTPDDDATGNAGVVQIINGSGFGLLPENNLMITQDEFSPGGGGSLSSPAIWNEKFGFSLASGDFDGDGIEDLAVGSHQERIGTDELETGAVFVINGSETGLTSTNSKRYHQDSTQFIDGESYEMEGTAVRRDRFGWPLAAGNFDGNAAFDLIVGITSKDRDDCEESGAVQIIPGFEGIGLSLEKDEQWFVRQRETIRAMITDLEKEEAGGIGSGEIWATGEHLEWRHVASVTKTMTLLLTVEAIEDGLVALNDMINFSEAAGTVGGSKLGTFDEEGNEIKEDDDEEIPFFEPGDTMPLRFLLHAMMNQSCNRSSLAIAEYVADVVEGDSREFINMMNDRADELNLDPSLFGHPAGGWVSDPQSLITLMREGSKHTLFNQIGGVEFYEGIRCGTDADGKDKCNGPFGKFTTIGEYPGRRVWKGGNKGFWLNSDAANDVPERPDVPFATASAVALVDRVDRTLILSLMQTGERTEDAQKLLDFGFQKIFTPDNLGNLEFPSSGGGLGSGDQIVVSNFAIDRITNNSGVTAIIDDNEMLQINIWDLQFDTGTILSTGFATKTFSMKSGETFQPATLIDMAGMKSSNSIEDFFTANLEGDHLDLIIWRVGDGY